jgi:hypothetical protein
MWFRVRLSRPNQCTSCHGVYSRSCVIDVMSGSGTHSMNVHAAQCVPTELSAIRKLSCGSVRLPGRLHLVGRGKTNSLSTKHHDL